MVILKSNEFAQFRTGPGSLGELLEVQGFVKVNHILEELNLELFGGSFVSKSLQNFSIILSVVLQLVFPKEVLVMGSAGLGRPIVSHVIKKLAAKEVNIKGAKTGSLGFWP